MNIICMIPNYQKILLIDLFCIKNRNKDSKLNR